MALEDKIDALAAAFDAAVVDIRALTAALKAAQLTAMTIEAQATGQYDPEPEAPADEPAVETNKRGRGRPRKAETAPPPPPPDPEPEAEVVEEAAEPEAPAVTAKDIIDAVARAKQVIAIPDLKKLVGEYSDTGKAADIPLSAGAAFIAAVNAAIAKAEEI